MKGLIIKDPWISMILDGTKTIELRGSSTNIRGKIGLIKSGSKMVFGEVELVDCIKLSEDDYYATIGKHQVRLPRNEIPYKTIYAWVIQNPKKYPSPVPYEHKQGCVIWVNI